MKTNFFKLILVSFLLSSCSLDFQSFKSSSSEPGPVKLLEKSSEAAVISQRQMLPNFYRCLKLKKQYVSNASLNKYNEVKSNLSEEGLSSSVSAPMMMAVSSVVSFLCKDLIEQEVQTKKSYYFSGYNFSTETVDNNNNYNIEQTISRLANSCWGRSIQYDELVMIKNKVGNTISIANKKTKTEASFVCTAVLASAQSVLF